MTPNRFVSICPRNSARDVSSTELTFPIAGIVNEDVEAAEALDRCFDSVPCLLFVRDVERYGVHTLSKLAGGINEIFRIARRGQHAVPGFERLFSEGSTKAAGSSRN